MAKDSGIEWTHHILRELTVDEATKIRDTLVWQTIQDAIDDYDFLKQVVESWVDGYTLEEQVQALSDEGEVLESMLGFNPLRQDKGVL